MSKSILELWTIYESPADYPGKFVVRRWEIIDGSREPIAAKSCFVENSLIAARERIPKDRCNLGRQPNDDPVIVETWI